MLLSWEEISEKSQDTCHTLFTVIREGSDLSEAPDSSLRVLHLCQLVLTLHEILIRKDVLLL